VQNNPSALYTHPNTNFTWVGFAGGQSHIYCAGYAGNKSIVYKTVIKADGTALDIPTVAGELPLGEVITAIDGYFGYIVLGLSDGFRFCSADDAGNLVIGPRIVTGSSVDEFAGARTATSISVGRTLIPPQQVIGRMDISGVHFHEPACVRLRLDGYCPGFGD
jgi:hypothetical protein